MPKFLFSLCLILYTIVYVSGQDSSAISESCKSICLDKKICICSLQKLGSEFQRLKNLKGSDCDKFGSNLFFVMNCLGDSLSEKKVAIKEVVETMGNPGSMYDKKVSEMLKLEKNEDVLVYFWRGWHDFMYLVIANGKVVRYNWWFALE
jgi:hypothetical protein